MIILSHKHLHVIQNSV